MTLRAAFTRTMSRILDEDESVVLGLGDIGVYGFKPAFEKHPTRVYNFGVAECGSIGLCAGLAMSGLYPVYSTISAFLLRRAYEFLRLDFGEQQLPGLFVGIGGRNEYAKLGPTHCCDEEFQLVNMIPRMRYYSPSDDDDAAFAITLAIANRELAYVRLEETG
jgi:transketolase